MKNWKKRIALLLIAAFAVLAVTGCGTADKEVSQTPSGASASADAASGENENTKTNIVYAKGAGPYTELFETAIIPILEKQGYTFTCVELELNYADEALSDGEADLSVEQHAAFMKAYNEQAGGHLVALGRIPTVPASIFSGKHTSLDEIAEGMTIAVPLDAGNQARAFVMLQDLGWITLKEGTDYALASPEDVESNPYNLEFLELQTTYIATSLTEFDYGIVTGSIVYFTGLDPSTALFNENLSDEFWLQLVVNEDNQDAKWAQDVLAAYQSAEFLDWLKENNGPLYNNLWTIPEYN